MTYKITEIEGIGPVNAQKLSTCGIVTTEELLKQCADKAGRKSVSEKCECDESALLSWVNKADLMRIKGIGEEYSDLLHAAGVDTVKELATRKAENLHKAVTKCNEEKNCCRALPSESVIADWIKEAGTLEAKITH